MDKHNPAPTPGAADRHLAELPPSRLPRRALWTGLGALGVALATDLGSKEIVSRAVPAGDRVGPLQPVYNPEFSLGIAGTDRTVMVILMLIGIVAAVAWSRRLVRDHRISAVAAGLAIGGAIANTTDRLLHGAVRDFLITGPVVINPADIAVLAGLALGMCSFYRTRPGRLSVLTAHRDFHAPSPALTRSNTHVRARTDPPLG